MDNLVWPGMELEANEREVFSQLRVRVDAWLDKLPASVGNYRNVLRGWASDGCLARYCRARQWDLKRAEKMLRASLEWRLEQRPEEITWEMVAPEAKPGRTLTSATRDRENRPMMMMRPGHLFAVGSTCDSQIRYLVYTLEALIASMPPDDTPRGSHTDTSPEQMVWCVDFTGYTSAKAPPLSTSLRVLQTLQNHYPERLGRAVNYNPPTIFNIFWGMISPFLDRRTANKVRFVVPPKPGRPNAMEEMFDLEVLEASLGGRRAFAWDFEAYGRQRAQADHARRAALGL